MGRWGYVHAEWWPEAGKGGSVDKMTFAGTLMDLAAHSDFLGGYADSLSPICDISNAVYVDGSPVSPPLDRIDFVKQHTGVFAYTRMFGEISTETNSATSRWQKSVTGTKVGNNYEYRFVNNSGYEVRIYLSAAPDPEAYYTVPINGSKTVTLPVSSTHYMYTGGNLECSQSGNTLTFTNGLGE